MQDQDARLAAVAERTAQIVRVIDATNEHCELIDPECKRVGEEFASNPDTVYHLKTGTTESSCLDVPYIKMMSIKEKLACCATLLHRRDSELMLRIMMDDCKRQGGRNVCFTEQPACDETPMDTVILDEVSYYFYGMNVFTRACTV